MITFLATSTVLFLTTLIVLVVKYAAYRREVDQIAGPEVNSLLCGNLGLFLRPPGHTIRQYIVRKFALNLFLLVIQKAILFIDLYKLLLNLVETHRSDGAFRLWFGPFHTMFVLTNADTVEVRNIFLLLFWALLNKCFFSCCRNYSALQSMSTKVTCTGLWPLGLVMDCF